MSEPPGSCVEKRESDPNLTPATKSHSKWSIDRSVKPKIVTFLEENNETKARQEQFRASKE